MKYEENSKKKKKKKIKGKTKPKAQLKKPLFLFFLQKKKGVKRKLNAIKNSIHN
jgi:hypothetical protein